MDNKLNSGFDSNYLSRPWFKAKWFKITLTALGVVAVVLIVLFNQRIGDLLKFFGSKAALETADLTLDGTNATAPNYFLANGYSAEIWNAAADGGNGAWEVKNNSVIVDTIDNDTLKINPQ